MWELGKGSRNKHFNRKKIKFGKSSTKYNLFVKKIENRKNIKLGDQFRGQTSFKWNLQKNRK